MKKQHKMFSIDNKMQVLAKVDTHLETRMDLVPILGLLVST